MQSYVHIAYSHKYLPSLYPDHTYVHTFLYVLLHICLPGDHMLFSPCPAALTAHLQSHGRAAALWLAGWLAAWLTTSSNAKCKSDVIATAPHLPNPPPRTTLHYTTHRLKPSPSPKPKPIDQHMSISCT